MNYPTRISKAGVDIYSRVCDGDNLFIPTAELEEILRTGLMGLNLDYPLRTRSKVLKSNICELLGYPVPKSFRKTQPRFLGQNFDTYIQKANNLQIWNEEISPSRRYIIVKVDERSMFKAVRVVTGEVIARLDTTGTLTQKFQAKSKAPVTASQLVTQADAYGIVEKVHSFQTTGIAGLKHMDFRQCMPVKALYEKLSKLVGTTIANPGKDQERNRGGSLHKAVCNALGMADTRDTGSCPDILEQLLEVKLQTSPTIDLGLVSPDDVSPLEQMPGVRHCDVRYAIFYGTTDRTRVQINHLVLCCGRDFFTFFQRFEGKIVNKKIQIPLPSDFFG